MELTKDNYRFDEAAEILGITRNKLWKIQKEVNFPFKKRGGDKREKWFAAETVQKFYDYLNKPQENI